MVNPDLTYTIRGHGPFAGHLRGQEEVLGVFQGIRDATANTMTAEPEAIVSSEEHIMAYMRVQGSCPVGRTYDSQTGPAIPLHEWAPQ